MPALRVRTSDVVAFVSTSVFVRTLSPGSAVQPTATADYQKC